MSDYKFLILERRGNVTTITLNRPNVLNAWNLPMREELEDALRKCGADDQTKAVILTGAGDRAFCAGQDLSETAQFTDGEQGAKWSGTWRKLYSAIREFEKPLIAALNGVAAGSAFQVAMMCDIRVGHANSKMGQPEINSGIPSTLGPWLMFDRIGLSRMIELTLTGRMMDGAECHAIGLIHYMTTPDKVKSRAFEIATELAEKAPGAMRENKRHFRAMTEASFQEGLKLGAEQQKRAFGSGEPQIYMKKFFEERAKRKAKA